MKVLDLINNLEKLEDKTKPFLGTFTKIAKNVPLSIFSCSDEYREIFASMDNDVKTMTISKAIEELKQTEYIDSTDIILTYGNEYTDEVSSLGGVKWKDNQLYLDTENCPRQF